MRNDYKKPSEKVRDDIYLIACIVASVGVIMSAMLLSVWPFLIALGVSAAIWAKMVYDQIKHDRAVDLIEATAKADVIKIEASKRPDVERALSQAALNEARAANLLAPPQPTIKNYYPPRQIDRPKTALYANGQLVTNDIDTHIAESESNGDGDNGLEWSQLTEPMMLEDSLQSDRAYKIASLAVRTLYPNTRPSYENILQAAEGIVKSNDDVKLALKILVEQGYARKDGMGRTSKWFWVSQESGALIPTR